MENILDRLKGAEMLTTEEAKRGLKRNVDAGHKYERECRDILIQLGYPHLVTTRLESQGRDQQKIDLMNKDEHINGRFEYNIQCKSVSGIVNYHNIFNGCSVTVVIKSGPDKGKKVKKWVPGMPIVDGVMNVIFHRYTESEIELHKTKDGPKDVLMFNAKGHYAIMIKKDFLVLMSVRKEYTILLEENKRLKEQLNRPKNDNAY